MFNTTTNKIRLGDTTNNLALNQPSTGMMQKSNPKSKFIRIQQGSDLEKYIFPSDGEQSFILVDDKTSQQYYTSDPLKEHTFEKQKKEYIEVIQILVFGDNYYLVEYICCSDLEVIDESN